MNLTSLSIKRPVTMIMLLLMVVVLGVASFVTIPMDLMPEIELPVALVMTTYGGASPEEVESIVTENIEAALASVEDLDTMYSYSMENMSIVLVQFHYGTDMNMASLNMREKIAMVSSFLPDDVSDPMVMKMDMNTMPVMQIYVRSDNMTQAELNSIIDDTIQPRIERAGGVASVSKLGGVAQEIAVQFNQKQMEMYGLSLATVSQILSAENINLPNGDVNKGDSKLIVRTIGKFESVDDVKELPLMVADRSVVRLGDVADIELRYAEQKGETRVDGQTAIGVMISKQSDANTVDTSRNVNKVLKQLEQDYPDMSFVVGYDAADYILKSISSVAQAALQGAILAIIIVFLFLRNIRSTLIIAISIPTSLLAAFAIMDWRGITLNLITLCALTICVGMLVDNSIVALENIYRWRAKGLSANEAAEKGGSEILLALIASTLTTVLVFLPIAVTEGFTSVMFADFCWTIIIALLASLLVAVTIVPVLSSRIMRGNISTDYARFGTRRYKYKLLPKFARFIENVTEQYDVLARRALNHRKKVIFGLFGAFVLSLLLVFTVGFELLPESDEGLINVTVEMPYGSTISKTDKVMTQMENYILGIPEVEHVAMSTEALSSMSLDSNGSLTVVLVDRRHRDRSANEVADEIQAFADNITEANITASGSSSISSMLGDADVTLEIKGDDLETLREIGYDLVERIKQIDAVTSAEVDSSDGSPEVKVHIDRTAAAYYGVTAYQLSTAISNAIGGTTATKLTIDGEEIEVNLSVSDSVDKSVEDMKQIMVTGGVGMSVPLGQIATFEYDNAPAYIMRVNQKNTINVNVNVSGSTATEGAPQVIQLVQDYHFPDGYYFEQSGTYDQMYDVFGSLFKALLVAVALVFLLLAAQFESVLLALVVMIAVPFAMTGAFIMLFLTGTALSMTSFLGLIMLVGTVVNTSILLVEFIRQYEGELGTTEALIQAGKIRLRPILMSCSTTIFGMIPMSLGLGEGGEVLAPMAISMIGGLIGSTIVTLFMVPVVYASIADRKARRAEMRAAKDAKIAALEEKWRREDNTNG